MLIIRNNILPVGRRYGAINLFGVLFVKYDMILTPEVINHEKIHTAQMRELFYLPFYIAYVLEWIYHLLIFRNPYMAYCKISFEREAYVHGSDLNYLSSRKRFAQWKRSLTNTPL